MNALIVVFLLILDYPGIIRFEARLSGFEEDYPVWIIRAHPGGNRIIETPGICITGSDFFKNYKIGSDTKVFDNTLAR